MNITYITALYNICEDKEIDDSLWKNILMLFYSNIKLIVYVDEIYHKFLSRFTIPHNVTITTKPLSDITIYKKLSANLSKSQRDQCKNYMAFANSKIEFSLCGLSQCKTDYIAWIEIDIAKDFVNPNDAFNNLSKLKIHNLSTILQHCTENKRFSGLFFICNRLVVQDFYDKSLFHIEKFFSRDKLLWEIDIWDLI